VCLAASRKPVTSQRHTAFLARFRSARPVACRRSSAARFPVIHARRALIQVAAPARQPVLLQWDASQAQAARVLKASPRSNPVHWRERRNQPRHPKRTGQFDVMPERGTKTVPLFFSLVQETQRSRSGLGDRSSGPADSSRGEGAFCGTDWVTPVRIDTFREIDLTSSD
jgi:hypothetical protein